MAKRKEEPKIRRIGAQGWEEFLGSKHQLLDIYENAKTLNKNRPVRTEHGNVAEAAYREWLSEFLPGRFGVTSGFIISAGYSDRVPLKHYDVIIYDKLEAPVLWHSNNADKSLSGKERAIPVEHVLHVTEVKAVLNKKSVKEACKKLNELVPLYGKLDRERKIYLPVEFAATMVFFEVDPLVTRLDLYPLIDMRSKFGGFQGGIILSSPDEDRNKSIHFTPKFSETPINSQPPHMGVGSLYGILARIPPTKIGKAYSYLFLDWNEVAFANFAHGIIRRINHDYDYGSIASWHGMSYGPYNENEDLSALFPLDSID